MKPPSRYGSIRCVLIGRVFLVKFEAIKGIGLTQKWMMNFVFVNVSAVAATDSLPNLLWKILSLANNLEHP